MIVDAMYSCNYTLRSLLLLFHRLTVKIDIQVVLSMIVWYWLMELIFKISSIVEASLAIRIRNLIYNTRLHFVFCEVTMFLSVGYFLVVTDQR